MSYRMGCIILSMILGFTSYHTYRLTQLVKDQHEVIQDLNGSNILQVNFRLDGYDFVLRAHALGGACVLLSPFEDKPLSCLIKWSVP